MSKLIPDGRERDPKAPAHYHPVSQTVDGTLERYGLEATGGSREPHTVSEYWRVLYRRKWPIILVTALCIAGSYGLTRRQQPVFRARASVEVRNLNEDFLNARNVSPTSTSSNVYLPEYDIQTQTRFLQSRGVLEGALGRTDLQQRLAGHDKNAREVALARIGEGLAVRAQPNTRLIEITYDSTDRKLAADAANAILDSAIALSLEKRWAENRQTQEWLDRQMEEVRAKLETSEDKMARYAHQEGLLFTGEKDNVAESRLRQLQDELLKAEGDRVSKQARYESAASAAADSVGEVLDDSALKDYQSALTSLRRQLAELSETFTPENPKVAKVRAQLAVIEAAAQKRRTSILARVHDEYQAARRREGLLASSYAGQVTFMSKQSDKIAQYNILKREVDTARQLYDSMLQRAREADMVTAMRSSNLEIADRALPPERPYKPSLPMNLAFGGMTGLLAASAFFLARERSDHGVREPGEVSQFLNMPELGVIPCGPRGGLIRRWKSHGGANATEMLTAIDDSVRSTLTSILFSEKDGKRPRVIVVSSAIPGEGKTTVISNLAIGMAQMGRRVLLVDGDTRRPRLHRVFDVDGSSGLSDVLARKTAPVLADTGIPNLTLLPGGRNGESNLLFTPQLGELIARLRLEFDTVLVDAPPVLLMPDARLLARHADGVILVVRAETSTRSGIRFAERRFAEDGTHIIGTILNDWNPKTSAYRDWKYYYKYKEAV